jgi:hypothetical protein
LLDSHYLAQNYRTDHLYRAKKLEKQWAEMRASAKEEKKVMKLEKD